MRIHSALFPPRVRAAAAGAAVHTHGMGGIGKTELAAKFADEFAHAFPVGVLWLNLADWAPARSARLEEAGIMWLKALDQTLGAHDPALLARPARNGSHVRGAG